MFVPFVGYRQDILPVELQSVIRLEGEHRRFERVFRDGKHAKHVRTEEDVRGKCDDEREVDVEQSRSDSQERRLREEAGIHREQNVRREDDDSLTFARLFSKPSG